MVVIASWIEWIKMRKDTVEFLLRMCCRQGHTGVLKNELLNEKNYDLLFNEAQVTHDDPYFWYGIIKERLGMPGGALLYFRIFASYGSPSMGAPDYPIITTPPILKNQQRISLVVPHYNVGHNVSLFFKEAEFHDTVEKYLQFKEFTIDEDVRRYISSKQMDIPVSLEGYPDLWSRYDCGI